MSTTTSTPTPLTTTDPGALAAGRTVLIAVGSAVAGAAIVAGLVFGLGGFGSAARPPTAPRPPVVVPSSCTTHHHVDPGDAGRAVRKRSSCCSGSWASSTTTRARSPAR